jgi:hypothetical protein
MTDAHTLLAAQQRGVLAALHGDAPPPAGGDVARFRVLANVLAEKRRRTVFANWPATTAALGSAAAARFHAFASEHRSPLEPRADGAAFVAWLAARGEAPRAAYRELVTHRLCWSHRRGITRRRRGLRLVLSWRGNLGAWLGLGLPFGLGDFVFGTRGH